MTDNESTTTEHEDESKTVTILDLCKLWGCPETDAEALQKFMGQEGPWTEAEATELNRRMHSMAPEDRFPGRPEETIEGPHGAGCECGLLTDEENQAVEELMAFLAPVLSEVRMHNFEVRTVAVHPTGDPETAIIRELNKIKGAVERYGRATAHIGTAVTYVQTDPEQAHRVISAQATRARTYYMAIRDAVRAVAALLPALGGEQAKDENGHPIWFLPAKDGHTWLTAAQSEAPDESWKPLYFR